MQTSQTNNTKQHSSKQKLAVPAFLNVVPQQQQEADNQLAPQLQLLSDANFTFQVQNEQTDQSIVQEFNLLYQTLYSLKGQNQRQNSPLSEEYLMKLCDILKEPRFYNCKSLKSDLNYVQCWITYAEQVKDPLNAYEFMEEHQIGEFDHKFYLNYVLHTERLRNFNKTEDILKLGLSKCTVPEHQKKLLEYYESFSQRMEQRIQRDLINVVGEEVLSNTFRKRKREEAFPDEIEESKDPSQFRKFKLNQKIEKLSTPVIKYVEGVKIAKQTNPTYQEILPDERIMKDYNQKPYSFLQELKKDKPNTVRNTASQSSKYKEVVMVLDQQKMKHPITGEIFTVDELRAANYKKQKEEKLKALKQQRLQQPTLRSQYLESIGEVSMDNTSNISKVSQQFSLNHHSDNQIKVVKQEQDSFQTCNQSLESNQNNNVIQYNPSKINQITEVAQMLSHLLNDVKKNKNDEVSQITNEVLKIFENVGLKLDQNQTLPFTQKTDQVYYNLPQQTQNTFSHTYNQQVQQQTYRTNFQQIPTQQQQQKPSYFTMKEAQPLYHNKENSQLPINFDKTTIPQNDKEFSKRLIQAIENDPVYGDLFKVDYDSPLLRKKSLQRHELKKQQQLQNDSQISDISFLQPSTPNNFLSKMINPNYSQEHFFRKKTTSNFKIQDEDSYQGSFSKSLRSSFGDITPMGQIIKPSKERHERTHAEVERDCMGTLPWVDISNKNQQKGIDQKQSQKRISVDSQGNEFQDCIDTFGNVGKPSIAPQSVMKSNDGGDQSGRNTSKSVRFKN